jgi:hypothetical protein
MKGMHYQLRAFECIPWCELLGVGEAILFGMFLTYSLYEFEKKEQ